MRILRYSSIFPKLLALSLVFALSLCCCWPRPGAVVHAAELPPYFAGAGTTADPYIIESASQLAQLAVLVNAGQAAYVAASYRLNASISLDQGASWTPIGIDLSHPFRGNFDGDGHVVTGLNVSASLASGATGYFGLFGVMNGTVQDLGLFRVNIAVTGAGKVFAGGLAGYISTKTVSQVYCTGTINAAGSTVYAGGLAGRNTGTITNAFSLAEVSGTGATIKIGGLVGLNSGIITTSYNAGAVDGSFSGTGQIGGITGSTDTVNQLSRCYYLDSAAKSDGAGIGVATACSFEQMKNPATFSGFSFAADSVWEFDQASGYPLPQLQKLETFSYTFGSGDVQQTHDISGSMAQLVAGTTLDWEMTAMRYLATIDSLQYQEAGFVLSNVNPDPLIDAPGCLLRATRTVYTSIAADGETVTAASLGGAYLVALTVNNIPQAAFNQTIYIRSYVKKPDGSISYGELKTFSVSQFFQ